MPATATSKHSREMSPFSPGDHMGTPVRDLMTRGVVSIPEDASLLHVYRGAMVAHSVRAEAVVALLQAGVSHVLVRRAEDAMPEGVLSDLDLIAFEGDS